MCPLSLSADFHHLSSIWPDQNHLAKFRRPQLLISMIFYIFFGKFVLLKYGILTCTAKTDKMRKYSDRINGNNGN